MIASPHNTRFARTIALVVALAATLVPAAQAGDKPDAIDRHLRNTAALDVRSPDRKFPPRHWAFPDAVDRALANAARVNLDAIDRHLVNTRPVTGPVDFRSPDTRSGFKVASRRARPPSSPPERAASIGRMGPSARAARSQ